MTTPSAPHPLKPDGAIRARLGGLLERRFASLGYGKVVAVLIVTTPLLAIYSRRQIVALLVVGAVAMLCVHRFGSPSKPVKWPRIDGKILATALMLLAWGVLSFLWTIDAKRTAGVSASFAGIGLCGFILIAFARLAGPRERNMVGNASLAAAWVGIAFIAFEAMIDLALIKWLWPLLGQVPPKFLVYLNFPMLVLTPLVPVGAAYALYRGWWWMALVLYGTALALASQMESGTALLALAASGAAIVIFAVLPGRLRLPSALLVVALGMAFVPALGRTLYNSETVVRIFAWVGDSASHRLSMWNRLGSLIAKRPVLGVGMGASRSMPEGKIRVPIRPAPPGAGEKANRSPLVPTIAMHPHNIGLEVGLELGLVGLLLAFGFLAAMVMGGFRLGADRWGQAGVAALAVSSTTSGMMGLSVWNFSYVSAHLIAIAALVVWTPQSAAAGINPGSQPS